MGIGPHESVGVGASFVVDEHDAGKILEVHLMADAGVRRYHFEVAEGLLSPLEKLIALGVALELHVEVDLHGRVAAVRVDLDGVVDDKFHGLKWVDLPGIAAEARHRIPHGGQIDDAGNAREVLEQDPSGHEGDFLARLILGAPAGERLDIGPGHLDSILAPKKVLEENSQRIGQVRDRVAL